MTPDCSKGNLVVYEKEGQKSLLLLSSSLPWEKGHLTGEMPSTATETSPATLPPFIVGIRLSHAYAHAYAHRFRYYICFVTC